MNPYIVIFILLFSSGCNEASTLQTTHDQSVTIKIGNVDMAIPHKYIVSSAFVGGQQATLDGAKEILLKIPLADLGGVPLEQNSFPGNITLLISPVTEHYQNNPISPDAIDAWTATGLYKQRVVKFDKAVELYRIFPKAGYPKLWHYFSEKPAADSISDARWVANCTVGPLENELKNMSNVTCNSTFLVLPLQIEASYAGTYIKSIDVIHETVINMVQDWQLRAEHRWQQPHS